MATLDDVEAALVSVSRSALYPNGLQQPSIVGAACKTYRGWPVAASLETDLKAGTVNVSVFTRPGVFSLRTRYLPKWKSIPVPDATVSAIVNDNTITFSGVADTACTAGIIVNRLMRTLMISAGDTAAQIAAAFGSEIPGSSVSGNVLTVQSGPVKCSILPYGKSIREIRRQNQGFQITIWAPSVSLRDRVTAAIDAVLAGDAFIDLPDGTVGRVQYGGAPVNDSSSRDGLWRRDLFYAIEYGTTETQSVPRQVFATVSLTNDI